MKKFSYIVTIFSVLILLPGKMMAFSEGTVIYTELGGYSLVGIASINIETPLTTDKDVYIRTGLSFLGFPLGINYIVNNAFDHKLEVGIGGNLCPWGDKYMRRSANFYAANIGYRYQSEKNPFFMRVGVSCFSNTILPFLPHIGLGVRL